jgi:cell division protein FtsB
MARTVTGRPRRAVTGRALVLGGLVVLLIVLLASPLNRYFGSRSDVSHTRSQLDEHKQQLSDLQRQLQLWSDPGYIQQQARKRLQYAMPGDTVYVVVGQGQRSQIRESEPDRDAAKQAAQPWNVKLWRSVETAGR